MTDAELLARLRGRSQFCKDRGEVKSPDLMDEAADHIEEIGAQLKMVLEREAETQVRHDNKIDAIEAKLDKAVAALTSIAVNTCCGGCQEAALVARAAIKGEPK